MSRRVGGEVRISDEVRKQLMRKHRRQGLQGVVMLRSSCRCGGRYFLDIAIHNGESTRRDCAECGRFRCFTQWHGQEIGGRDRIYGTKPNRAPE